MTSKKIWVFIAAHHDGNWWHTVMVEASTKAEVGRYVKDNPDKFKDIIKFMEYCDDYQGEIAKALYPEEGDGIDITTALSSMEDEDVVDEFWAYSKDSESQSVTIGCIHPEKIIRL